MSRLAGEGSVQVAIEATAAERRAKAVQMRTDGYSLEHIAYALEYDSVRNASLDISKALQKAIADQDHAVDVYREIELRRLDAFMLALQPGIQRGVPRSVEIGLKVSERRAKLLGLDAVSKIELTTMDSIDEQIKRLTAELELAGVEVTTESE